MNLSLKNPMILNIETLDTVILNLSFYKKRGVFKTLARRNVSLYLVITDE